MARLTLFIVMMVFGLWSPEHARAHQSGEGTLPVPRFSGGTDGLVKQLPDTDERAPQLPVRITRETMPVEQAAPGPRQTVDDLPQSASVITVDHLPVRSQFDYTMAPVAMEIDVLGPNQPRIFQAENYYEDIVISPSGASFVERNGKILSEPENQLPIPLISNNLFYTQLRPFQTQIGQARAVLFAGRALSLDSDLLTSWNVMPNFGVVFDTGSTGSTRFDVPEFPLGPQIGAGQSRFFGMNDLETVPLSLLLDNQVRDVGGFHVQGFAEFTNYEQRDQLRVEHLYGRLWNLSEMTVGAGMTYSLFGTAGAVPATLQQDTILVGTGELEESDKPAQVRFQRQGDFGLGWGIAIEEPLTSDFVVPAGGTSLTRWPNFVSSVQYKGRNQVDWLKLSAIVRGLGFAEANGNEHLDTAWGLAGYFRKKVLCSENHAGGLFGGVAGGNGVGDYVHGVGLSAAFDGATFSTLEGLGTYVGYRHDFHYNDVRIGGNIAYGYAMMTAPAFLPSDTNTKLQQAWANVLYYPNNHIAIGLEYQFGSRQTLASGGAEDSRFMFVIAVTKAKPEGVSQQAVMRFDEPRQSFESTRSSAYLQGL